MSEFEHVRPGDKKIRAKSFNTMLDAAKFYKLFQQRRGVPETQLQPVNSAVIIVANDADTDVDRFGVMAILEPLILPADNEIGFQDQLVMKADIPATDDPFGILLDPLPAKTTGASDEDIFSFGRLMVAGVTQARITISDPADLWADVSDGDPTQLESNPLGSARILWSESGSGATWAVVLLTGVPAVACNTAIES